MGALSNQVFTEDDMQATAEFYDALHIQYEKLGVFSAQSPDVTSFGPLRRRITDQGLGTLIKDGVVLDAGCGAWQKGVRILGGFGPAQIEAVDLNKRSIAHCQADPQANTHYSNQDLAHLSFDDNTFDFIICEGVMHHTIDPKKTMDELFRVLKPGGVLTLGVYCWRPPYSILSWFLKTTIPKMMSFNRFLELSGKNRVMLIFADLIYVPIEHFIKEGRLLCYLDSKKSELISNEIMSWPIPLLGQQSSWFYQVTGMLYKHIFIRKAQGE